MLPREAGRPPPRDAEDGLPPERPAKELCSDDSRARTSRQPSAAALDHLRFDCVGEMLDLLASFAVSGREAARRGSPERLRLHCGQAKRALAEALEVEAQLGTPEAVA
jgi:hypothetical protein